MFQQYCLQHHELSNNYDCDLNIEDNPRKFGLEIRNIERSDWTRGILH